MNSLISPTVDKDISSASKVQARKHICYCALTSPSNSMATLALRAPASVEISLSNITEEQRREIYEHLCSYTEEILICEQEGRAVAVIPSLYPSSSLCPILVFDEKQITLPELLRLIECDACPNVFRVSDLVSLTPARLTSVLERKGEVVFSLFGELDRIFTKMNRLCALADEKEIKRELCRYAYELAYFVGCPIERINELWDEDALCSLTDMPLYSAFLLSFFMMAREYSPSRRATIELRAKSSAAEVSVVFESESSLDLLPAMLEWERLASERNMLFGCDRHGNEYRITFHPLRRDWSYLGIKQNIETI